MEFSTFQICKEFGIDRSALRAWLDYGYIVPSISKAQGRGTRNKFSLKDAGKIFAFSKLRQLGFSRKLSSFLVNDGRIEELVLIALEEINEN